MLVFIVSANA